MNRLRVGKLVIRDPVLLCGVVYLLLYFDASGFLRLGLLAAVLHELGHILVYCIQQRRLPVIEVTMTGFCMRTAGERFSPLQRFVLAAAGPAVKFALAGVWAVRLAQTVTIRDSAFWAANLLTGLFNLLPVPPLDGSRVLLAVLPEHIYFGMMKYERVILIVLLAAVWGGFLDGPLSVMNNVVWDLLDNGTQYIDTIAYSAYYASAGAVI